MSNKKMFQKVIESDLNKTKNYNSIMDKIENTASKKLTFKLRYVCVTIILLIIGIIGVSAAIGFATKNYRIETKDNLPYEESSKKYILFDNKINKDYDSKLFQKDEYYTYEEIEKKLNLKLLKNKNFDSNMYISVDLKTKNDKIAQVSFWQTNSDKSSRIEEKYQYSFAITTNYFDGDIISAIIGGQGGEYREYYIKSLNSMAIITKPSKSINCGPARVHFSYKEVVYILRLEHVCFDGGIPNVDWIITESELYDFLEAFSTD